MNHLALFDRLFDLSILSNRRIFTHKKQLISKRFVEHLVKLLPALKATWQAAKDRGIELYFLLIPALLMLLLWD